MNPAAPDPKESELTPQEWEEVRAKRAARAMQKRSATARWKKLTPKQRSEQMRKVALIRWQKADQGK